MMHRLFCVVCAHALLFSQPMMNRQTHMTNLITIEIVAKKHSAAHCNTIYACYLHFYRRRGAFGKNTTNMPKISIFIIHII